MRGPEFCGKNHKVYIHKGYKAIFRCGKPVEIVWKIFHVNSSPFDGKLPPGDDSPGTGAPSCYCKTQNNDPIPFQLHLPSHSSSSTPLPALLYAKVVLVITTINS